MKYPFAFFDVDSLEVSPNGRTYTCHPQVSPISDDLYEVYSIISGLAAPLVFSVDVNRNIPNENNKRRDFLPIPLDENEKGWHKSVIDWYKFYIQRETISDKEKVAVFNHNKNTKDCIKLINSDEWIVFGNGIINGVNHVIENLLEIVKTVKFVPELIIPGENETKEQFDEHVKKWKEKGAIAITLDDVTELARCHQY